MSKTLTEIAETLKGTDKKAQRIYAFNGTGKTRLSREERFEEGSFALTAKKGDSNKRFFYPLYLKNTLEQAIAENQIQQYHFTLLRNLYEKTANFLGYPKWSELLPDDKQTCLNRIIQFTSHSTLSSKAVAEPSPPEQQTVKFLLDHLVNNYGFWPQEEQNG